MYISFSVHVRSSLSNLPLKCLATFFFEMFSLGTFIVFSGLPQIETALLQIQTALSQVETALPQIETALLEIEIVSKHASRFAAGRSRFVAELEKN